MTTLKKLTTIQCPALNGKKLIKDSDLFSWIDSDFENYGTSEQGEKTKAMKLSVLEMTEDASFKQMFTEQMALTQEQIIWFIREHRDKLRDNGYSTFFLFKSGSEFFVAYVDFSSDGALRVYVYRLELGNVWRAGYRRRLVAPQLALENSETDTQTLCSFDPEKFKITYDNISYKLIKI
jgi:hypothetical protein